MNRKTTVAVAGCGSRGMDTYTRALLGMEDTVQIVACADINPEKLAGMRALCGLTEAQCYSSAEEMLMQPAPYVRVLAVNGRGQRVLRQAKQDGELPLLHTGQRAPDCAYAALERRAADLFPLFCEAEELHVNLERKARILRIP